MIIVLVKIVLTSAFHCVSNPNPTDRLACFQTESPHALAAVIKSCSNNFEN